MELAAELLVLLIEGRAPAVIVAAHLSAQVAGHPKPNDSEGARPLAIGSVLRRIALKAVCQAFSDDIREASGLMQFEIGRAGGPELMHKCLLAWVILRPQTRCPQRLQQRDPVGDLARDLSAPPGLLHYRALHLGG